MAIREESWFREAAEVVYFTYARYARDSGKLLDLNQDSSSDFLADPYWRDFHWETRANSRVPYLVKSTLEYHEQVIFLDAERALDLRKKWGDRNGKGA